MGKEVVLACFPIQRKYTSLRRKDLFGIWRKSGPDLSFLVGGICSGFVFLSLLPPFLLTILPRFPLLYNLSISYHTKNKIKAKASTTTLFLLFLFLSPTKFLFVFFSMAIAAESQFHVLAVDDSLMDRKLIERLLKTSSFQVTTVDSGTKALEYLQVSPDHQEIEVNLIITDYCMPEMTGYDLLKKIKESSYLKDIPVVIMSSENVPSRINRCLEEGAEEFFLKPVQLSDVSRLRPHILKGKSKEEKEEQLEEVDDNSTTAISNCTNSSCTKRKFTDEGIFPEKTRPRLSSTSLTLE